MRIKTVFLTMAGVYALNRIFGWAYDVWPNVDIPMHILGGALAALLGLALWEWVRDRWNVKGMASAAVMAFMICFAVLIATLWEFHEFLIDWWHVRAGVAHDILMQPSLADTMKDEFDGLLGAVIIALVMRKKIK